VEFREVTERESPTAADVGAVVVTHHPDRAFSSRLDRYRIQVACTVVVDNGSDDSERQILETLAADRGTHVIANADNLGVATALNQGVRWLRDQGFQWALLFDQDTEADAHIVKTLLDAYAGAEDHEAIAVIGSNYRNEDGVPQYPCPQGARWIRRKTVITSGSLVSIRVFDRIGGFRDDLFIDHVDHEYCLRAAARGFKTIMACRPGMTHAIGHTVRRRVAGVNVERSVHAARRYYYNSRNHVILTREFAFREPLWVIKLTLSKMRELAMMCLFDDDKWGKLKSAAKGYWDGMRAPL
jgi:rhamnosyltransferase